MIGLQFTIALYVQYRIMGTYSSMGQGDKYSTVYLEPLLRNSYGLSSSARNRDYTNLHDVEPQGRIVD